MGSLEYLLSFFRLSTCIQLANGMSNGPRLQIVQGKMYRYNPQRYFC